MTGGTVYGNETTLNTALRNTASNGHALYVSNYGTATRNGTPITAPGSGWDQTIPSGGAGGTVIVSYNINGGTGTTPSSQTVTAGSSITLPSSSGFANTGYTFTGWNTNSNGQGANYDAGSSYTAIGNITLYAKWDIVLTANTCTDGSVTSGGVQWFRFTATAATQYLHVSFGTLTDLWVQLYDSNYTTVGAETNLYSSTRYISRTVTAGQVYYIRVRPYSGSGTFRVTFNASSTAPTQ